MCRLHVCAAHSDIFKRPIRCEPGLRRRIWKWTLWDEKGTRPNVFPTSVRSGYTHNKTICHGHDDLVWKPFDTRVNIARTTCGPGTGDGFSSTDFGRRSRRTEEKACSITRRPSCLRRVFGKRRRNVSWRTRPDFIRVFIWHVLHASRFHAVRALPFPSPGFVRVADNANKDASSNVHTGHTLRTNARGTIGITDWKMLSYNLFVFKIFFYNRLFIMCALVLYRCIKYIQMFRNNRVRVTHRVRLDKNKTKTHENIKLLRTIIIIILQLKSSVCIISYTGYLQAVQYNWLVSINFWCTQRKFKCKTSTA